MDDATSGKSVAPEHVQDIYNQLEAADFARVKPNNLACFTVVAFLVKSERRDARRAALERAD
jgi:hypothetical protein